MRSVIVGAILLLFAFVFIARAADARPLANCWAYDADGFSYPVREDGGFCFDTPAKAKEAALKSCRKHSDKKATCKVVTCGWCGQD